MKQPADSCATVQELLLDYAYGELEGAPRKDVEAHVAGCAGCRIALMQLSGTRSLMAGLKPEPAPEAGLESLLAYAEQAARNRAAETAPATSSFWRWLVPALGLASASAVALLFVVNPADPSRGLAPSAPSAARAPSVVTYPAVAKAEPRAPELAEVAKRKAEKSAEAQAEPEKELLDAVADKNGAVRAQEPANVAMKDARPADAPASELDGTFGGAGAGIGVGSAGRKNQPLPGLAKDSKAQTAAVATGAAQKEQKLAEEPRQAMAAEGERNGRGGGGEAIGSKNFARARAQTPMWGAPPPEQDQAVESQDRSKTASATISNADPFAGATPAPMPAPKPAAPSPAPPAAAVVATRQASDESKKRDVHEEQTPVWGAPPPAQEPDVAVGDLSMTASPGMSNVDPLAGATPAPMPGPKPAASSPAPPAAAVVATRQASDESKKRDVHEEQTPVAVAVAEPAAESAARADDAEDRHSPAAKKSSARLSPEELLRKGQDQSENGDLAGAEATYASFLTSYPTHKKAQDVAWWRVELLERLGRTGDASVARAQYARRWPSFGTGSPAGASGPRGVPASPARAAPMEKAKAADLADEAATTIR